MKALFCIVLLLPLQAFSQFNYSKISLSLGGGASFPHMDITENSFEPVVNGALHYNISPYSAVGLETEIGTLKGSYSTRQNTPEGPRDVETQGFSNKFVALHLNARIQGGQFTGRDPGGIAALLSHLYAGLGLGLLHSNAESWMPEESSREYKSSDIIVPLSAGVHVPLFRQLNLEVLTLFLNYRLNVSFSDELDALNNPGSTSNDHFSTFTAGLRFNIGPKSPYFYGKY